MYLCLSSTPDVGRPEDAQTQDTSSLDRVHRLLLRLCNAAALLLTPGLCRACALPLLRADAYPVCASCLDSVASPTFALCWTCGDALGVDEERAAGFVQRESLRCPQCFAEEPHFARALAFGSYRGTLRNLIHLHKFEGVRSLAVPLGERLAQTIADLIQGEAAPLTAVAVPLFRGKRSFNQSELLADEALRHLHRTHPEIPIEAGHHLLRRVRPTESQSHLTPDQRRKNVRNAFTASADVHGRRILLVDDVLTTGATANECAAELLRAGAASVHVATLARAHRRDTIPAEFTAHHSAAAVPIHRTDEGEKR